jgi:hypothetical protein
MQMRNVPPPPPRPTPAPPRPLGPTPVVQPTECSYPLWCKKLADTKKLVTLDVEISDIIERMNQSLILDSKQGSLIEINQQLKVDFAAVPVSMIETANPVIKIPIYRIEWFYDGTDSKSGEALAFLPYSYEISNKLEEAYVSELSSVVVSEHPKREVMIFKTFPVHKQFRKTENGNPEGRNVYRGYKNWKCYSYPGYPEPLHWQVWNVDLDILMRHPFNKGETVPLLFRKCIQRVQKEGPLTEGIFRINGSKVRKDELKREWNSGFKVEFDEYHIPDITDLMKDFVRNLPHRLCPTKVFNGIKAKLDYPAKKQSQIFAKVLNKLPVYDRNMIVEIILLLKYLLPHQNVTKMDEKNLAICWSPNLFEENEIPLEDTRLITTNMIKHLDESLLK